jgi:hypothetical protein
MHAPMHRTASVSDGRDKDHEPSTTLKLGKGAVPCPVDHD